MADFRRMSPGRASASGVMPILRDEASLNVLIPMGGSSEAFREAGYSFPKPLIKIAGRPMLQVLLDNLHLRLGDVVWLIVPAALHTQYESDFDLQRQYPSIDVRVVPFKLQTRGVIEAPLHRLQTCIIAPGARI